MKIKTIDVNAKEWFDKVNGNSYFSAKVILNYGTMKQCAIDLPFQYGYGEHYIDMAKQELIKHGIIKDTEQALFRYCFDNKIILRAHKEENCKKRDVEFFGGKQTN